MGGRSSVSLGIDAKDFFVAFESTGLEAVVWLVASATFAIEAFATATSLPTLEAFSGALLSIDAFLVAFLVAFVVSVAVVAFIRATSGEIADELESVGGNASVTFWATVSAPSVALTADAVLLPGVATSGSAADVAVADEEFVGVRIAVVFSLSLEFVVAFTLSTSVGTQRNARIASGCCVYSFAPSIQPATGLIIASGDKTLLWLSGRRLPRGREAIDFFEALAEVTFFGILRLLSVHEP
jgi:hypothetical protein